MKVILLKDVAKIGRRSEVVSVPDGYALNKLIPQKMAQPATAENLKKVQARSEKIEADRVAADATFDEALEVLGERTITLEMEANENGHLFKAVSANDVLQALHDEGVSVTKEQIVLPRQIKEVGTHEVQIVSGDKSGSFELDIVAK